MELAEAGDRSPQRFAVSAAIGRAARMSPTPPQERTMTATHHRPLKEHELPAHAAAASDVQLALSAGVLLSAGRSLARVREVNLWSSHITSLLDCWRLHLR